MVLADKLSLGDRIDYEITMHNGTIEVTVNNKKASQTYTAEHYGTDDTYYFKAGNYIQYKDASSTIYSLTQFFNVELAEPYTMSALDENTSVDKGIEVLVYPNPAQSWSVCYLLILLMIYLVWSS